MHLSIISALKNRKSKYTLHKVPSNTSGGSLPRWAGVEYSSVGDGVPEDVWKGGNKFKLHRPSFDWLTESSLLYDGNNNKQTQYPQGIYRVRRKLRLLKICQAKIAILLGCPIVLLFVYCLTFLFYLGFISRLHCRVAMRSRCLSSCRSYRLPA